MNPIYYSTPQEVAKVVDILNRNSIGGGVRETRLNQFVGPFVIPDVLGKTMAIVVLNNEVEMSAGLTYDLLYNHGHSEASVLAMLSAMANGH